jgi:hypothetical protein
MRNRRDFHKLDTQHIRHVHGPRELADLLLELA